MEISQLPFLTLICAGILMLSSIVRSRGRNAVDVMLDLSDFSDLPRPATDQGEERPRDKSVRSVAATEKVLARVIVLSVVCVVLILRLLCGSPTFAGFLVTLLIGAAIGYLAAAASERRRKWHYRKQLEFYIPIVMERIVMAVQAGHDVLAALKVVVDVDEEVGRKSDSGKRTVVRDPVTLLMQRVYRLAESGRGVELSLHDTAAAVDCPAIRHAFLHLAQAHKEGGELVIPLRELSDSTQLYYQESVEEEIAKLPVKATLPLLCAFAGLITFFLTAPMMQVLEITSKAMPR